MTSVAWWVLITKFTGIIPLYLLVLYHLMASPVASRRAKTGDKKALFFFENQTPKFRNLDPGNGVYESKSNLQTHLETK